MILVPKKTKSQAAEKTLEEELEEEGSVSCLGRIHILLLEEPERVDASLGKRMKKRFMIAQ